MLDALLLILGVGAVILVIFGVPDPGPRNWDDDF